MSLLEDLIAGKRKTDRIQDCSLCEYIAEVPDANTKQALSEAAAGKIGLNKLAEILRVHQTGVGRRTIERHRREEHTL